MKNFFAYNRLSRLVLCLLLLLCPLASSLAAPKEFTVRIHFRLDYAGYESGFMDNDVAAGALTRLLGSVDPERIQGITVTAYSSPEGSYEYNIELCELRLSTMRSILDHRFPKLAGKISYQVGGEAWDMIRQMVKADESLKDRSPENYQLINDILSDKNISNETRKDLLRSNLQENWYGYLRWIHYHDVRLCEIKVLYDADEAPVVYRKPVPKKPVQEKPVQEKPAPCDTVYITRVDTVYITESVPVEIPAEEPRKKEKVMRPIFALGSNVLYDAAITPNVSLEIPMGKHWSLLADYTFPWWVTAGNDRAWQIQKWDLGLRYWIGRRQVPMDVLRGHFIGLDLSAGYYDIEPKHTGYQGEFQLAGLEYGYGFKMGTHWRLDLCVGAGWMGTRYRRYNGDNRDEHLLYQYNGRFTWFGPTKVGVTIKYVISTGH